MAEAGEAEVTKKGRAGVGQRGSGGGRGLAAMGRGVEQKGAGNGNGNWRLMVGLAATLREALIAFGVTLRATPFPLKVLENNKRTLQSSTAQQLSPF